MLIQIGLTFEMEDLIEHLKVICQQHGMVGWEIDGFISWTSGLSYVMLLAHQKYSLNLSEVTNIEMTSRFVDFSERDA